jgi:hypothetical protein
MGILAPTVTVPQEGQPVSINENDVIKYLSDDLRFRMRAMLLYMDLADFLETVAQVVETELGAVEVSVDLKRIVCQIRRPEAYYDSEFRRPPTQS